MSSSSYSELNLKIFETAQVAFGKVGNWLQDRRKHDFYELMQYHASSKDDPAGEDESLMKKLEENRQYYSKRMDDVIDRFVFLFSLSFKVNGIKFWRLFDTHDEWIDYFCVLGTLCVNGPAMMKVNDEQEEMSTEAPALRMVKGSQRRQRINRLHHHRHLCHHRKSLLYRNPKLRQHQNRHRHRRQLQHSYHRCRHRQRKWTLRST